MIDVAKLMQDPRMTGIDCLLLEEGMPPSAVDRSSSIPLGDTDVTASDIDRLLNLIPEDKRNLLVNRAVPSCRLVFPDGCNVQFSVLKDEKGHKLAFKRMGGAAELPRLSAAAPQCTSQAVPPAGPKVSSSPAAAVVTAVAVPAPATEKSKAEAPAVTARVSVATGFVIDRLFGIQMAMKASDMHLSAGVVPLVRKDGEIMPMEGHSAPFSPAETERILWEIMPEKNREEFQGCHDTDFAYEFGSDTRMRCNVFMDRKGMGGVFRAIPKKILTSEELGLSPEVMKLCSLNKGLVVVTGPTGSGKSTTLCALVDYINRTRRDHILTIEDPIEFVHENKNCLVNQREVHNHTESFAGALRAALREDPDILLIGEMRDLETVAIAIETAETGHLVFGTLHTNTAPSTVHRIVDQFPADRQAQIRLMLAESLKGVIAQTLCRKIGGGRIAALETLFVDQGVANLIREGKTMQIQSAMQTGKAKGNVTLTDALFDLVKKGIVEPSEAYAKAVDRAGFEALLIREKMDISFLRPGAQG